MKKSFSIFLVSLITLNLIGFYPAFMAVRRTIRREVREKLMGSVPKSELSTLVFKTANGRVQDSGFVLEKPDEFSYQGEMYDIVSADTTDGQITFHCLVDTKETSLVALLRQKIKRDVEQSPDQTNTGNVLAKVLASVYLPVNQVYRIFGETIQKTFSFQLKKITEVYPFIDTPPPKYLV